MTVEKFDKKFLGDFRNDFANAVAELEKQHGIKIDIGNIRFDADRFSGKLEVKREGGKSALELDYERYKNARNLPDFGTPFKLQGENFEIAGYKPRSRKFPVIGKNGAGQLFKFSHAQINNALGIKTGSVLLQDFGIDLS